MSLLLNKREAVALVKLIRSARNGFTHVYIMRDVDGYLRTGFSNKDTKEETRTKLVRL